MASWTITHHLDELLAERRAALRSPLARNGAYMADLEAEIAVCRRVVALAEVTERAVERAATAGMLHG